jgi:hypothetical protein
MHDPLAPMSDRFMTTLIMHGEPLPKERDAAHAWFTPAIRDRMKRWPAVPSDALSRDGCLPLQYVLSCVRENLALAREFEATGLLPAHKLARIPQFLQRFVVPVYSER